MVTWAFIDAILGVGDDEQVVNAGDAIGQSDILDGAVALAAGERAGVGEFRHHDVGGVRHAIGREQHAVDPRAGRRAVGGIAHAPRDADRIAAHRRRRPEHRFDTEVGEG
jgi:hypothetical protein